MNMKSSVDQLNMAQLNALASLSNLGNVGSQGSNAATMQAFQQQLFRGNFLFGYFDQGNFM